MEDARMNLLRSICCLFAGRCAGEEPKEAVRAEPSVPKGDLGQGSGMPEISAKCQKRTSHIGTLAVLSHRISFAAKIHSGARLTALRLQDSGLTTTILIVWRSPSPAFSQDQKCPPKGEAIWPDHR
jgi:hypothetical protein